MGNSQTTVTSGVKKQADSGSKDLYKYVDSRGGGVLVTMMKEALRSKDYTEIDEVIENELQRFLYNNGEGKLVHISEVIEMRAADKNGTVKGSFGAEDKRKAEEELKKMSREQALQSGRWKEVCWKLSELGAVGETVLHMCLLNNTQGHARLAKRLLRIYPQLVKDLFVSEEYYGENALHMAIVNEDPSMVKWLLDSGADYKQRCCGAFFSTFDQKPHRTDTYEHEWVSVPESTNYEGQLYWGEYPLNFAAVLGQEECARLLVAKGADPNAQDANGNTVLHILVIHDRQRVFDLMYDLGARLNIKNRQGLTPLTLAAKLARKEMHEHILEIERDVYWIYGNVTCAGYPLEVIDTINPHNGKLNTESALYLLVHGGKPGHLDMMEGMLNKLLQEKWKSFCRTRFLLQLGLFCVYFVIFAMSFILRPGADLDYLQTIRDLSPLNCSSTASVTSNVTNTTILSSATTVSTVNMTTNINATTSSCSAGNNTLKDPCYLLKIKTNTDYARFCLEIIVLGWATCYLFFALQEMFHLGVHCFFVTLGTVPARCSFLMSCVFVVLMLPGRAFCYPAYEDIMGICAILCTAPYFLFFCRGFRIVGPFVIMIYKMIHVDLIKFATIYIIFLIGFSQGMYIVFRGVKDSYFSQPHEALMGMFIMSLGEFGDIYESFKDTKHENAGKGIFVFFMILVTLLLVNMLIAMMGNTYSVVSETKQEWSRQWAKIVLVIEQSATTTDRIQYQLRYSQPMTDGRRALVIRWNQTEKEREELKRLRKLQQLHQKNLERQEVKEKGGGPKL